MAIPGCVEWIVASPTVRAHNCPRLHGRQNKRYQRFLLPVCDNLKPEPPHNNTPAMPAFGGLRFSLPPDALSRSAFHLLARLSSDQVRVFAREGNRLTWLNFDRADDQRLGWTPFPSPCVAPPTSVSSTSTEHLLPLKSRFGRTLAARSLWSIWKAVS